MVHIGFQCLWGSSEPPSLVLGQCIFPHKKKRPRMVIVMPGVITLVQTWSTNGIFPQPGVLCPFCYKGLLTLNKDHVLVWSYPGGAFLFFIRPPPPSGSSAYLVASAWLAPRAHLSPVPSQCLGRWGDAGTLGPAVNTWWHCVKTGQLQSGWLSIMCPAPASLRTQVYIHQCEVAFHAFNSSLPKE